MDVHALRHALDGGAHAFFQLPCLRVIGHDGVEVQGELHARFLLHGALQPVQHGVRGERGKVCIHLDVRRRKRGVPPVAVHADIVHAAHALAREQHLPNARHELRVGRLPQKFGTRLLQQFDALPCDEHGDQNADPAVGSKVRELRDERARKHGERRNAIAGAVRCRRAQGIGARLLCGDAVHTEHARLDGDRDAQHEIHPPYGDALRPANHLFDRLAREFDGEHQHEKGDTHGRDVLRAPVPVGVLPVRGLARDAEGDERHDAPAAVTQIVDAVREHGQQPRQRARGDLARRKEQVTDKPRNARACLRRNCLCLHNTLYYTPSDVRCQLRTPQNLRRRTTAAGRWRTA